MVLTGVLNALIIDSQVKNLHIFQRGDEMNPFAFYRQQAGLKQEEAAKQLCVDRSTISKWETGASLPTVKRLIRTATLYGCKPEELITEKTTAK